jgi:hypothetical protein
VDAAIFPSTQHEDYKRPHNQTRPTDSSNPWQQFELPSRGDIFFKFSPRICSRCKKTPLVFDHLQQISRCEAVEGRDSKQTSHKKNGTEKDRRAGMVLQVRFGENQGCKIPVPITLKSRDERRTLKYELLLRVLSTIIGIGVFD